MKKTRGRKREKREKKRKKRSVALMWLPAAHFETRVVTSGTFAL